MSDNSGATGFAIGVAVGAAAGLIIGLLYAPRPGEETRELAKERAKELQGKGIEFAERARDVVNEVGKKVKESLEEA